MRTVDWSRIKPTKAVKKVGMVVEVINTIPATLLLAEIYKVSMPVTEGVNEIINNGRDPQEMVTALMNREKRSEVG